MSEIFQINFVDGSSVLYEKYSGFRYNDVDVAKPSCSAKSLAYSVALLEKGEPHKFHNFYATLPVDLSDPVFVKMFIEDNFPVAGYVGETPEIPYNKIDRRFIQE